VAQNPQRLAKKSWRTEASGTLAVQYGIKQTDDN